MKVTLLFLILFAAGILCQTTLVQWGAVVNTTSTKGQFRQRITRARLLNAPNIVGGLLKSVQRTLVSGETTKDGIRFSGYAINPLLDGGVAPTASAAFFTKEVDVSNNNDDGNGVTYDVTKASNFVAVRFFSLEEVDVNGNVVNTVRFRGQTWSVVNSSATSTESDLRIPFVTIGSNIVVNNQTIVVQVSFIATADLVTITIPGLSGGPIVPPKGLEVIFAADLTNYPYANTANYLRLVTYTATGTATRSTNVVSSNPLAGSLNHTFISSVVNNVPMNIRFDQRATLNGNRVFNVAPNSTVSTSFNAVFNGTETTVQIQSFFGANSQLTRTDVPFPVNARELVVYDPTVSFGTDPTTVNTDSNSNFASYLTVSTFILMLCILAQLL